MKGAFIAIAAIFVALLLPAEAQRGGGAAKKAASCADGSCAGLECNIGGTKELLGSILAAQVAPKVLCGCALQNDMSLNDVKDVVGELGLANEWIDTLINEKQAQAVAQLGKNGCTLTPNKQGVFNQNAVKKAIKKGTCPPPDAALSVNLKKGFGSAMCAYQFVGRKSPPMEFYKAAGKADSFDAAVAAAKAVV